VTGPFLGPGKTLLDYLTQFGYNNPNGRHKRPAEGGFRNEQQVRRNQDREEPDGGIRR
jgi:hypothetical protein